MKIEKLETGTSSLTLCDADLLRLVTQASERKSSLTQHIHELTEAIKANVFSAGLKEEKRITEIVAKATQLIKWMNLINKVSFNYQYVASAATNVDEPLSDEEEKLYKTKLATSFLYIYLLFELKKFYGEQRQILSKYVEKTEMENYFDYVFYHQLGSINIKNGSFTILDLYEGTQIRPEDAAQFFRLALSPSEIVHDTPIRDFEKKFPDQHLKNIEGAAFFKSAIIQCMRDVDTYEPELEKFIREHVIQINSKAVIKFANKLIKNLVQIGKTASQHLLLPTPAGRVIREAISREDESGFRKVFKLLGAQNLLELQELYRSCTFACNDQNLSETDRAHIASFTATFYDVVVTFFDRTLLQTASTINKLYTRVGEPSLESELTSNEIYLQVSTWLKDIKSKTRQRIWEVEFNENIDADQELFSIPDKCLIYVSDHEIQCNFKYSQPLELHINLNINPKSESISWSILESTKGALLHAFFQSLVKWCRACLAEIIFEAAKEIELKQKSKNFRPTQKSDKYVEKIKLEQRPIRSTTLNPVIKANNAPTATFSKLDIEKDTLKYEGTTRTLCFEYSEVVKCLDQSGIYDPNLRSQILSSLLEQSQGLRPFFAKGLEGIKYSGKTAYSCRATNWYRALLYLDEPSSSRNNLQYRIYAIDRRDKVYG